MQREEGCEGWDRARGGKTEGERERVGEERERPRHGEVIIGDRQYGAEQVRVHGARA